MPALSSDRLKPEREIDGDRRFADSAFAGCDGDKMFDARHALCLAHAAHGWSGSGTHPAVAAIAGHAALAGLPNTRMLVDVALAYLAGLVLGRQHRDDAAHALDLPHDLLGRLAQRLELPARLAGTVIEK